MQTFATQRLLLRIAVVLIAFAFCMTPMVSRSEKSQPTIRDHMQCRIQAGKTKAAISATKELIEYYTTRFQPVSVQVYIEKSNGIDIFHAFTDYRDLDEYKKITSKARSDPVWQAMFQQALSVYMEGDYTAAFCIRPLPPFRRKSRFPIFLKGQEGKSLFLQCQFGSHSRKYWQERARVSRSRFPGHYKLPQESRRKSPRCDHPAWCRWRQ